MYNPQQIEKKWQDKWEQAKIFEANPNPDRKKIFITSPYPYASGPSHIGHGRSFVNGDVFARYYRAKGYNVLYPMAFHITGTPVLAISSSIERNDKGTIERMEEYVSLHTTDREQVKRIVESFVEPWNIVNYFSDTYKIDFKSLGMSLDWRREFTTGDKLYNKLIEWQYHKLFEQGYLEKDEYPILYCPQCGNAVGEDDISSGDELNLAINEYTCIKFPFEDAYLVPSTLRPETIYGATNLWMNPTGTYVYARVNGDTWVISEEATLLLKNQNKDVEILEKFKGVDLIGKKVKNIDDSRDLLILPGDFVDTTVATGVVYSVPAHAPYDYIALLDLQKNDATIKEFKLNSEEVKKIEPIQIIDLLYFEDYPAKVYCEKFNVKTQTDFEKLDKATAENYKVEYYNGILNDMCGKYKGMKVKEAVVKVIDDLIEDGMADKIFLPITKDLRCKCGKEILVSIISDQWFLNFDAGDWKQKASKCLNSMKIVPNKYRMNFEHVFNWLEKRPCARKRGLGTQLPFDKNWIIESLSDSTIYMSFYPIIHLIKKNDIKPEQLIPAFFDYILLNIGDINSLSNQTKIEVTVLKQMQQEFYYWYPVDHRHTAIMHISNHLSFYIFHHVAIFPEEHWPKIVSLIEPVIIEGQKMGKSKGNVISIANIKDNYSADLFRFYISHSADFGISVDWREKQIQIVKNHIIRFYNFISENTVKLSKIEEKADNLNTKYAKIILSKCTKKFVEAEIGMKDLNIRKYLQLSFYEVFNIIQDFNRYCEDANDVLEVYRIIFPNWVKILSLTMPHLCEELWEMMGNTDFLSNVIWDDFNKGYINNDIESEFDYISDVITDILTIQKIVSYSDLSKIYLYTAPSWKYEVLIIITSKEGDFKEIIDECKLKGDLIKNKDLISYVKSQIKDRIWEKDLNALDEETLLEEYRDYIEKRIKGKIYINSNYDPKNRSVKAVPFKPAIYADI
ncbi:MAG TPA: leucine--tRNA ligase [Candidatus Nanopelagicaceae bacterium]|nr:leucine--tRNA ligase [Candidatus Nanopelagicaceae bacterium]